MACLGRPSDPVLQKTALIHQQPCSTTLKKHRCIGPAKACHKLVRRSVGKHELTENQVIVPFSQHSLNFFARRREGNFATSLPQIVIRHRSTSRSHSREENRHFLRRAAFSCHRGTVGTQVLQHRLKTAGPGPGTRELNRRILPWPTVGSSHLALHS